MNKVHFEGRLVKDPDFRTTSTGKTLTKFSLAVKDSRNEAQTFFFDCTAWEPIASQIAKSIAKGAVVAVDGRLTTNIYTNKEGRSVKSYDTIVESIKIITSVAVEKPVIAKPAYVSIDDPAVQQKQINVEEIFDKVDEKSDSNEAISIEWMKDLE